MEIHILIQQFDQTIYEGVIALFDLEYFIKKVVCAAFLHFKLEFFKTLHAYFLKEYFQFLKSLCNITWLYFLFFKHCFLRNYKKKCLNYRSPTGLQHKSNSLPLFTEYSQNYQSFVSQCHSEVCILQICILK